MTAVASSRCRPQKLTSRRTRSWVTPGRWASRAVGRRGRSEVPARAERVAGAAAPSANGAAEEVVPGPAPGEAVPGEAAPGEAAPGEAVPGEAAPGEAVPGEAVPGEAAPGEAAPGEAVP